MKKKTDTLDKLLEASRDLFSKKWYETVSVAEICREAGVSNGVFYRYFKNKKSIFEYQVDELLTYFEREFNNIRGITAEDRLEKFLDIVIQSGDRHRQHITIFREAQYRFPEFEKRLRKMYIIGLSRVFNREISETEYLFVAGAVRFINIRYIFNSKEYKNEILKNIIINGIFEELEVDFSKVFSEKLEEPDMIECKTSRCKLINAGIKLFGEKGYYNVNIYDITKEAGYAVGTFYIYFNSKEEFLSSIVDIISKNTRRFLSLNSKETLNRLEKELRGIYLFLFFFSHNKSYYEIVREAEFVVNESVKRYYDNFERGYQNNLDNIKIEDKSLIANFLMGFSHYLGIEKLFLENVTDEKVIIKEVSDYFKNGIKE